MSLHPEFPPEAPWVTKMRRHFAEHGFYRQADLDRLLGKPGESASLDANGNIVLRRAALAQVRHPSGEGGPA